MLRCRRGTYTVGRGRIYASYPSRISARADWRSTSVSRSRLIRALFFAPLMVRRPTPSDFPLTMAWERLTPCLPSSLVTVKARLMMLDCTFLIAMLRPFHFALRARVVCSGRLIASLTFFIYYTDFFSKNKSFLFSQ